MDTNTAFRYAVYAVYDARRVFVTAYKRYEPARLFADGNAEFYKRKKFAPDSFIIRDRRDNNATIYDTAE